VKSVQFDTLSHLVLGRASTFSVASGNDPGVLQEATIASNWYSSGEVEAREMVVRAFSFHNYTNVSLHLVVANSFTNAPPHRSRTLSPSKVD
jgi:N-terminal acetyltransferase B complex non-catalytic subunit